MARPVETSGTIETFCTRADAPASRRSAYGFDQILIGDRVALSFNDGGDTRPPYSLRIKGPNGALVLDRILRELPTGLPQSEPPVVFVVSAPGEYVVDVKELSGKTWGHAIIRVD